jgi:DNA-binding transcriptional regulator LsrR (DeoR family)
MTRLDDLRLLTKVARMYYEQGMRQSEIADRLYLSQATISRLLRRAEQEQIVRITVSIPNGVYVELEDALVSQYGLLHAVVADCEQWDDDEEIQRSVGAAAAYYLESTIKPGEFIGISSWSATLLAMVYAMHPIPRSIGGAVVQILGGARESPAKTHAVTLTSQLAKLIRGEATFLSVPVVVGSQEVRDILLSDPYVHEAVDLFDQVTLALVGIGTVEPSPLLASSGNIFSPEELANLADLGAVGDVLNRFFDAQGHPVRTPLNDRVIGMNLEQLKQVGRSVGVAGGKRKHRAIRGALLGGLVNVLITDHFTAEQLVLDFESR